MTDINNEPRLYILMRTDLPGATPGKLIAQGTHAANQAITVGRWNSLEDEDVDRGIALETLINDWEEQSGYGFGTAIVLGVNEQTMRQKVLLAQNSGLTAGITHDPSYPVYKKQRPVSGIGTIGLTH